MPAIIFDLFVLGSLVYTAVLGSTVGTYKAAAAALEIYVAFALAVLLHEPIAGFLTPHIVNTLGPFLSDWLPLPSWTFFLTFAGLLWGTFLWLWIKMHPRVTKGWPETEALSQADRFGGAAAGWYAGMLLVGGLMVTVSMLPIEFLRFPSRNMLFDVGRTALHGTRAFTREFHDGLSLVLYGEPASRASVAEARLTSEPRLDPGDGKNDDTVLYYDVDGNGSFTADLYYLDVDSDSRRRVGLVEKYVMGRWDAPLTAGDRERGEKPQLAAKPSANGPRNPAAERSPPPSSGETVQVNALSVPELPALPKPPGTVPPGTVQSGTVSEKPTKPAVAPQADDF